MNDCYCPRCGFTKIQSWEYECSPCFRLLNERRAPDKQKVEASRSKLMELA